MSARVHVHACAAVAVLLLGACASAPRASFRTGASSLPPAWVGVGMRGTAVALHHTDGGAIAASISCDAVDEDAPLDVLLNHLLLQIEKPVERARTAFVIDGRAALRVQLGVRLDGVPVELELVLFKKDGCVIDAQLAVDAQKFPARRADFELFLSGLSVERKRR